MQTLVYTNVLFTCVQKGGNPMSPQDCMLCMLLERWQVLVKDSAKNVRGICRMLDVY